MMAILMIVYMWVMVAVDLLHLWLRMFVYTLQETWKLFNPAAAKSVMGEVILVTGTGHGIGKELALQLARLGAKVVCWDINQDWNNQTVAAIEREGGVAYGYKCDIADREEIKRVSDQVRDEVGDLTIIINNAGIMPCKPFLKHTPSEIEKLFRINILAHFWIVREWLPTFQKKGRGHIVALSSVAGIIGGPNLVPYCSTKFAVTGFMEGLQEELRYGNMNPGIKLTRVHPFVIDTGLAHKPRIRFPNLTPITPPEKCAEIIIDGFRRDDSVIFVPTKDYYLHKMASILPIRCQLAFRDFMDTGVDEHDY